MKKAFLLFLSLTFAYTLYAQLKVTSDGKVYIQHQTADTDADVYIGESTYMDPVYDKKGLYVHKYVQTSGNSNCGIYSEAVKNGNGDCMGIFGIGSNLNNNTSTNYGVVGTVQINARGAGICGTSEGGAAPANYITGNYAGYFFGETYLDGCTTAAYGIYDLSDMRLKGNVVSLSDNERRGSVLSNLMSLDVVEYDLHHPREEQLTKEMKNKKDDRRHFGVFAQELQKIYPNLVREGQDGYLTVNYVEIVPLLLRSIQELKQELDKVKGTGNSVQKARRNDISHDDEQTSGMDAIGITTGNRLFQNTPNPFTERTEICFTLAENAQNAYICIFDMTGKMLKQIPVDSSMQSVTVNGYELSAGIYLYSLVVNGQEIDTKRMILSD